MFTDDNTQYIAKVITETVSALDAGHAMGIHTDYKGRCPCPFHGGTHNNLKLYGENRGYYCFVCHEHGNVIDLVKKYQGMSFREAVIWINDTFGLNLNISFDMRKNIFERRKHAERVAQARKRGDAAQ